MPKAQIRLLWLVLPLIPSSLLLAWHARGAGLLGDTDTKVLLAAIRQTANPWAWFAGDWPLKNHFYRPISTLFFEADNALYGNRADGYGLTNALLCVLCIFMLFWVIRELLDNWAAAGLASLVFGLWHLTLPPDVPAVQWVMLGLAFLSLLGLRHGRKRLLRTASTFFACLYLSTAYGPLFALSGRMIYWLPGRTASIMTLFCLAAIASYTRWERLTAERRQSPVSSTERPLRAEGPARWPGARRWAFLWLAASFVFVILALGSYEQAVMLPALLLCTAALLALNGIKVRWPVHAGFWACLGGYLILRSELVSSHVSRYQAQQFRDGPGVMMDLARYLFPPLNDFGALSSAMGDPLTLLTNGFWSPFLSILGFAGLAVMVLRDDRRWTAAAFYLMAFVAFLPMAWFKMFEHYHYWAAAYRAAFSVAAVAIVLRGVIASVSPQGLQAPPRRRPAPGSLPHRDSSLPSS